MIISKKFGKDFIPLGKNYKHFVNPPVIEPIGYHLSAI